MDNTRRTSIAPSAYVCLPKDPQTVDLDVHVPATTRIPMNTADVVNPVAIIGTISLATTACQSNTNIPVDLNSRPLPPREDPPLVSPTEGRTHGRQPLGTIIGSRLRYYAGEIGPGVGQPTIGEPHLDLGEDLKLARLREAVGQAALTEEPLAVDCDIFTQQRRKFLRWMDDQEYILRPHQMELDHCNREASNLIRWFNQRIDGRGQDLIRDPLQGRLVDRSERVY
uniref:Uncharacterized protein n=1 Tax=Cannabis sativa TaxID=3483 RepID=A0A803PSJ7_CANSA